MALVTSRLRKIEIEKDRLELEKLRIEVERSKSAWWTKPAYLSLVVPLIVAFAAAGVGFVKYYYDKRDKNLEQKILLLEERQGELEKTRDEVVLTLINLTFLDYVLDGPHIYQDEDLCSPLIRDRARQVLSKPQARKGRSLLHSIIGHIQSHLKTRVKRFSELYPRVNSTFDSWQSDLSNGMQASIYSDIALTGGSTFGITEKSLPNQIDKLAYPVDIKERDLEIYCDKEKDIESEDKARERIYNAITSRLAVQRMLQELRGVVHRKFETDKKH